ncbi:UNVERIFIED_CONTAM: hypothetical protein Sradi_4901100 [Sesamum radiatum]|uniref:Uncharacterized protein n=1 Tax=Sesamum radiatum TaxID=300843 RepID=A0AAW2MCA0_SESRA
MERTFVDSLLEHARHGQFQADRENKHAVHCSLRLVNKGHGSKITAAWAFSRVKKL